MVSGLKAQSASDFYGLFDHLSVGVNASTTGIGVDVATNVTKFVGLRLGLNMMPSFRFSQSMDLGMEAESGDNTLEMGEIDASASFSRTTVDLLADVYPFGNSIFVTGGFSFGGSKVVKVKGHSDDVAEWYAQHPDEGEFYVQADKYQIPVDRNGNMSGGLKVAGFRPYLGVGFGSRAVPKSRVGFRFELGLQFHGKPKVYTDSEDYEIHVSETDVDDDISKWISKGIKVYPVIKFRLCGRIF